MASCSAGALGSQLSITETLVRAAPMIFTGLAVAVAFRAKFWNIGAEGQLMAGAVAANFVGAYPMPGPLAMALMALAGAAAGGIVALVPALLRVKLKVDDVVSSLLLNSVVFYAVMALIEGPWKDPFSGYPISPPIEDSAGLPQADRRHQAASRRARRLRRRRPGLVADDAHHARLQDPRHRRECGGRALRRHRRRQGDRRDRADLRRRSPGWPAWARSAACTSR